MPELLVYTILDHCAMSFVKSPMDLFSDQLDVSRLAAEIFPDNSLQSPSYALLYTSTEFQILACTCVVSGRGKIFKNQILDLACEICDLSFAQRSKMEDPNMVMDDRIPRPNISTHERHGLAPHTRGG